MAGAGYRLFNTGDVLTAAQVNTYLQQQVIMVFVDASARTTALSGVLAEGMFSYLTGTNAFQYYDGAAWADVSNPGDITGVTAGTGLSGGGTSGAVTVSIDTATTVDKTTAQTLTNKTLNAPIISSISNTGTLTLPTSTDTLVGLATTDTLTNKTLTSPTINDPKLNLSINANTSTTYTFVLADNGKLVTSNNASAQTLSIPTNASVAYPVGTQINVAWITGAGQPTINAVTSGTTTVLSTGATSTAPKLRVVNSVASCVKIATDIWLVTGDVA
jgi:hypothetical protein